LVALARGLPPHAFFVGDPGVKLIAARNALAHPTRPLEIPLPAIGGEQVLYVDPFFALHGSHTHAVTPELFPLVSAPFIAAFGVRGAYVLPAAGLLLALAACVRLARALDPRRSPVAVLLTTFLATPLVFYGLEFWEHALAAGVAALAAARFVVCCGVLRLPPSREASAERRSLGGGGQADQSRLKPAPAYGTVAAGLLFGIAALLRPEALWFAVAVLACAPLLPSPPTRSTIALAAVGIVAALLPLEAYTLLHFGRLIPPHIAGNPAIVSRDWLAIRADLISSWFGMNRLTSFWRVAPAIVLAFVPLLPFVSVNFFCTGGGAPPPPRAFADARSRLSSPASEHSRGRLSGHFRKGQLFLIAVAMIDIALVVLTAPNDGGGQWGPRYLLLAYLPLAILASDAIAALATYGGPGRRISAVALVAFVALGSAWIQRSAYKELRAAKMTYARLVDFVAREVPPGAYAVTDLWWLDQVAASLTDSRRMLYVADPNAAAGALTRLDRISETNVTLIRSRMESSGSADSTLAGTCYTAATSRDIPERTLTAMRLRRSC
jgi:hypothetical protein